CLLVFSTNAETTVAPGCQRTQVAALVSPNEAWIAVIQEEICEGPGIATTGVSDVVRLVPRGNKPEVGEDVFAIEEDGDPAYHPVLRWLTPRELRITVPNKSLIGLQKSSYEGVDIVVKFEPDEPAARARWLKSLGLPAK
ncbi:MAG TPA: hypothetical protein VNF99_11880, partial [Stellaceae bacterium]|nr:hypothetical protein [Stellaceae bacterium]